MFYFINMVSERVNIMVFYILDYMLEIFVEFDNIFSVRIYIYSLIIVVRKIKSISNGEDKSILKIFW